MRTELLGATCDFLRENPDGFEVVSEGWVASGALAHLVKTDMPMPDILVRLRYAAPRLQRILLGELVGLVRDNSEAWKAFLKAAITMPREHAAHFDLASIGYIWDNADTVPVLLRCQSDFDEDHPLFPYLIANQYWMARVRRFIALNDLERAASELRKALRGFPSVQERQRQKDSCPAFPTRVQPLNLRNRCLYICRDVARMLIRELFEGMVREGFVQPITLDDCILKERWVSGEAIHSEEPGTTRHVHKARVPRAGVELALLFVSHDRIACGIEHDQLEADGAMILKIADYFRGRRNDRRRIRREAIVAAQAASPLAHQ